jgi:hypothetical protein
MGVVSPSVTLATVGAIEKGPSQVGYKVETANMFDDPPQFAHVARNTKHALRGNTCTAK